MGTAQSENLAVFPEVASTQPLDSSNPSSKRWLMTIPTHKLSQHKPHTLQCTSSVHSLVASWPDFSSRQSMSSPSNMPKKLQTKNMETSTVRESNEQQLYTERNYELI